MIVIRKKCLLVITILAFFTLPGLATAVQACGVDTDCEVGSRTYRIALPESGEKTDKIGAVIFAHGYRGTAAGVMRNKGLISMASDLNAALVAAQASGPEWNIPNIPSDDASENVDELAYFDDLVADLTQRFNVDPSKIMVAGFSSGAMMVWHLACFRGSSFAGFAPMSGTFWEPIPETCPTGPVNLIHFHGKDDPVVPLHGRQIKDAHQGDVFEAVNLMVRAGDYRPVASEPSPGLECSKWADGSGHSLELCLFDGEHTFRIENLSNAASRFLAD